MEGILFMKSKISLAFLNYLLILGNISVYKNTYAIIIETKKLIEEKYFNKTIV